MIPGDTHKDVRWNADISHPSSFLYLPFWLSSYKYMGKQYECIIDGAQGRASGTKPVDALRIIAFIALFLPTALWSFYGLISDYPLDHFGPNPNSGYDFWTAFFSSLGLSSALLLTWIFYLRSKRKKTLERFRSTGISITQRKTTNFLCGSRKERGAFRNIEKLSIAFLVFGIIASIILIFAWGPRHKQANSHEIHVAPPPAQNLHI